MCFSSAQSRRPVNRAWGWAVRSRSRSDRARDRAFRSKPGLGPGLDRGKICRVVIPPARTSPQPGPIGLLTGTDRSKPGHRPGHDREVSVTYRTSPGWHQLRSRLEPGHPVGRPVTPGEKPGQQENMLYNNCDSFCVRTPIDMKPILLER